MHRSKIPFAAFLLMLTSCTMDSQKGPSSAAKQAVDSSWSWPGTYRYRAVSKNHTSLGAMSPSDTMWLSDTAFLYDIESLNKHAAGTYSIDKDAQGNVVLVFNYRWANRAIPLDSPLIRRFTVSYACCDSMHVWEALPNGDTLRFAYVRQKHASCCP